MNGKFLVVEETMWLTYHMSH